MPTTFAIPENPPGSQPVDAPSVWQRFAPDLPAERVMWSEIVPGGCHWSWVMPRGSRLRMVALEAGANLSMVLCHAREKLERYNMPDSLKAQHTAHYTRGHVLMSDMDRALAGITADTVGWHDPLGALLAAIHEAEASLPAIDDLSVPTRTVWLPLSWDDPATREAIDKYMQSVRPDAPWCPSNIEFIRRINGLDSIEAVQRTVFEVSYLVMGLGDVYLGAPVATPLDPRHSLVTTKYNPARTWTPENAVGIGGAYLCVYGMEGPGGYQFVGRTVQMWNRWLDARHGARDFELGKPWLLRFFDQIRFYP
jgi:allophanate hydrolase subunit 1